MNITVEELDYIFKLGQSSVSIPAPVPESVTAKTTWDAPLPVPPSGSDIVFLQYVEKALDIICQRSSCGSCSLYRGKSELCIRNFAIQEIYRINGRTQKGMENENS